MRRLGGLQGTLTAVPPQWCMFLVVLGLVVCSEGFPTEKEQILTYLAV